MANNHAQVNLNIDEMKEFLRHITKNNQFLQNDGKPPVAIEVVGESGIGKTSASLQLAEELGTNHVKLNLAQIEELGDLVGFPVKQFQLCKSDSVEEVPDTQVKKIMVTKQVPQKVKKTIQVEEVIHETKLVKKQVFEGGKLTIKEVEMKVPVKTMVNKEVEETIMVDTQVEEEQTVWAGMEPTITEECIWIDDIAVQEYLKRGYIFTGQKRMSYCPPEWIAGKENGGFLILDDWNRADIRFIQAVMELVDRQEYISWKLPKGWTIMLTANPDNGEYLVQSIDVAQRTRFISMNLKSDVEVWARWAETQKIDGRCINFLLMHPELVSQKVNPRAITNFFNSISSIPDFMKALPLIQMCGEGSVGPEFTVLFTTFINNKLDKLVTPKDMLLHDNEAFILGELRSCIGRGNDYRADIASVLATRLINWTLHYSENNTIAQKQIDRLITYATDPDTFTDDLKYILVKKILNGNKQKFQKMMLNQEVIKMSMK